MVSDAAVVVVRTWRVQRDGPHANATCSTTVGTERESLWVVPSGAHGTGNTVHIVKSCFIQEGDGFTCRDGQA